MTEKTEWWRGAVIYQIYPRSFADSNGDGIGDLNGITEKLDYVASLGVEGVWISPFFTSPMADFGYDVSDYQNIDPIFGTLADFDRLAEGMHKRGLKLIIDFVVNHTSEKHPWFSESRKGKTNPKSDWYIWADPKADGTPPNNWLSVFGGPAWQYDTKRGQYYFHQFLKQQPDLNIHNHEVQDEILRIARWWMDRGVDGFRLDALNHCIQDAELRDNPPRENFDRSRASDRFTHPYNWQQHLYDKSQPEMIPFIRRLRKLADEYEGSMLVAEVNDDYHNKTPVAYTNGPEMLHTAYSFALLGDGIYSAKAMRAIIEDYFREPGDSWPSWSFSNHDVKRVASRWPVHGKQTDDRQVKMLIALLASLKGTAFLYEGEELGLGEADIPFEKLQDPFGIFLWPEDKGRDGCRTPMPWDSKAKNAGFSTSAETWLPIPIEHMQKSVSDEEKDASSPLNFTRGFLKWRKAQPILKTGDINFIDTAEPVLAFTRVHNGKKIFCFFNLGAEEIKAPLPDQCQPLQGHGLPFNIKDGTLTLPPFGGFFGIG